jgi:hypothetical protein
MIVDPIIWYTEREINLVPPHFHKCSSPITDDSLFWIRNKTNSRYVLVDVVYAPEQVLSNDKLVYFESEQDAMMYELLWSGSI